MVAIYNLYNVAPLVSSHLAASLFIALSCHNRKLTHNTGRHGHQLDQAPDWQQPPSVG
jgi:hypothetical protein